MNEKQMANAIRFLSMDAVQAANSGHPGMPLGMADVATVLFNRFMKIDPATSNWADRDRFVLSAGHGSMLIYSINHLLGYSDMSIDQVRNFRQLGSTTPGHPEHGHTQGIETTTGPLGQGISTSVGMAMAEAMLNARYGDELVDHFTYVIAGDGCLMEGVSHEAIDLAGHLKLGKLIVMWDDNKITIDGSTDLATSMDQKARFAAAGWHVQEVDGHDNDAISAAIEAAQNDPRPSMIDCKTIIGFGAPTKAGTHKVHGSPLGDEEISAAREAAGWDYPPFEIPEDVYADWRTVATRGAAAHAAWHARLEASDQGMDLQKQLMGIDSHAICKALDDYRAEVAKDAPKLATRQASQKVLEVINNTVNNTVGGSADLTGSNLTLTDGMAAVTRDNYNGRYVYYGIREHGMAAAMNGIALHGGYIPYGGTFTIFVNYMWAAMRLSALMEQQVLYVLTHDSIGQGEDGPTHQPIETLAALRATPNTMVFRPADIVEVAEAYEVALMNKTGPSAIVCSRQGFPAVRNDPAMKVNKGAYVLRDADGARDVTLIATGSEVHIAVEAAEKLAADGIKAAVVSAPCFELFDQQSDAYRDEVLGEAPRIGVEAATRFGWDGLMLRQSDGFIGMTGFGASAPGGDLYKHFGITSDAIAAAAKSIV